MGRRRQLSYHNLALKVFSRVIFLESIYKIAELINIVENERIELWEAIHA
jgi:hypothetical protein